VQHYRKEIIIRKGKNKESIKRERMIPGYLHLKINKMKSLKTKLASLFVLAFCFQVLTASTASTCATQKSKPVETKQAKPKKATKGKSHLPLYKSLLNHF
jgi:hypothetical protein